MKKTSKRRQNKETLTKQQTNNMPYVAGCGFVNPLNTEHDIRKFITYLNKYVCDMNKDISDLKDLNSYSDSVQRELKKRVRFLENTIRFTFLTTLCGFIGIILFIFIYYR